MIGIVQHRQVYISGVIEIYIISRQQRTLEGSFGKAKPRRQARPPVACAEDVVVVVVVRFSTFGRRACDAKSVDVAR
jgi:hypothetical protein